MKAWWKENRENDKSELESKLLHLTLCFSLICTKIVILLHSEL